MNPFFNEDHESIREMARDFAEKTLAPIAAEVDKTEHFPEDVVKQMADLGFLGLKIPEEYGGLGLDMRSYVCVMEEIAKKCATATLFISSANSLSTAPIVISGTDEQKAKYLPGVAAGEEYIAFGLTEPNAGSDAASMTTKAVEDGDCYILNGRKCFITMAPISKYTIVYAKTNPEKGAKGISCFMVDMSLPGVSCGKHEEKMGQRGVPVSDVVLEDVRVPKECMIGEKDLGFINAMKTLSVGRIGVASMRPLSWPWSTPRTASSSASLCASTRPSPSCWPTWRPSSTPPAAWSTTPPGSWTTSSPPTRPPPWPSTTPPRPPSTSSTSLSSSTAATATPVSTRSSGSTATSASAPSTRAPLRCSRS